MFIKKLTACVALAAFATPAVALDAGISVGADTNVETGVSTGVDTATDSSIHIGDKAKVRGDVLSGDNTVDTNVRTGVRTDTTTRSNINDDSRNDTSIRAEGDANISAAGEVNRERGKGKKYGHDKQTDRR